MVQTNSPCRLSSKSPVRKELLQRYENTYYKSILKYCNIVNIVILKVHLNKFCRGTYNGEVLFNSYLFIIKYLFIVKFKSNFIPLFKFKSKNSDK